MKITTSGWQIPRLYNLFFILKGTLVILALIVTGIIVNVKIRMFEFEAIY